MYPNDIVWPVPPDSVARILEDVPKMTTCVTVIALRQVGDVAWIAYELYGDDRSCAILRFEEFVSVNWGWPNDDRFETQPLFGRGLECYEWHEVLPSPERRRLFIAPCHEGTLTVVAGDYAVEAEKASGLDVRSIIGDGPEVVHFR